MKTAVPDSAARAFAKLPLDLHKYSAGVVAVAGGSARYANAPVMAALGARAGGAGLVRLVAPAESRFAAAALVPEATFTELTKDCTPPDADVTAVGMGLGTEPSNEELLSRILSDARCTVVDADALAILAKWRLSGSGVLPKPDGRSLVLTPHAGEAARLLDCTPGEVMADRHGAVRRIADLYAAVAVLKGRHTLVAAPNRSDVFECQTGNPFMALGGMGDLLAGALAARWARLAKSDTTPEPEAAFAAACAAVWLHGAASDGIVASEPPGDPSVVNTARAIASLRVSLER